MAFSDDDLHTLGWLWYAFIRAKGVQTPGDPTEIHPGNPLLKGWDASQYTTCQDFNKIKIMSPLRGHNKISPNWHFANVNQLCSFISYKAT